MQQGNPVAAFTAPYRPVLPLLWYEPLRSRKVSPAACSSLHPDAGTHTLLQPQFTLTPHSQVYKVDVAVVLGDGGVEVITLLVGTVLACMPAGCVLACAGRKLACCASRSCSSNQAVNPQLSSNQF